MDNMGETPKMKKKKKTNESTRNLEFDVLKKANNLQP